MMKTDKHKLILNEEQKAKLLTLMHAYQKQKNYFSDCLNSACWNDGINFKQGSTYFEIRNSLVKNGSFRQRLFGLSARVWKLSLKEAFDLHYRTYSAKIEQVKEIMISYIFDKKLPNHYLHFLNATFYNFSTFRKFEQHFSQHKNRVEKRKRLYQKSHNFFQSWFKDYIKKTKFKNYQFEHGFVNKLFNILKKKYYRNYQIISNFNPTIQLDSDCYKLITKPGKTKNFLEVVSLESGKRIKNIELTGYKGSLPKKTGNIMLSFNPVSMDFYLHFAFRDKVKDKTSSSISTSLKTLQDCEDFKELNKKKSIGMDLGQTETGTLSDGKVIGFGQGKFLKKMTQKETVLLSKIQTFSKENYFGKEKINKGKRNNTNNGFNHNKDKGNINTQYRETQQKINRQIEEFLHKSKKELIHHCLENQIDTLVVEKLSYSNLGRRKTDKKIFNLVKGFYGLLEENLQKYNIKLCYVNPAYTSQTCPSCYYLDKNNRNRDKFCCLGCGYKPTILFEKGKEVASEADFVAANNILAREHNPLLNLNQKQVKEWIMRKQSALQLSNVKVKINI